MTQDEQDLKDYALDHLEHFDGLPCDFETESGEVWDYDKCWALYEKWGLVDLMSENMSDDEVEMDYLRRIKQQTRK